MMKQNSFHLKTLIGAILTTGFALGSINASAAPSHSAPSTPSDVLSVSSGSDGVGDLLLYPFYTTENGNKTLFHLVNTSSTDTVIAKVRLRDYKDSNDVLDITVILSPEDVFAGTIHKGSSGQTVFTRSADDNTCTSPVRVGTNRTFTPSIINANGHTGHIEVITEGTFSYDDGDVSGAGGTAPLAYVATTPGLTPLKEIVLDSTHDANGDTVSCADVDKYFAKEPDTKGRYIGVLQDELHEVEIKSVLTGHYTVLGSDGVQAGGRPTVIAGAFRNDGDVSNGYAHEVHSPCRVAGDPLLVANDNSIVCGQYAAHFSYPHLGHVTGIDVDSIGAGATNSTKNITAFNEFQDEFRTTHMMNEWSKNPANGVNSEVIFTLPTKYIYNDSYPAKAGANANPLERSQDIFSTTSYIAPTALNGESNWDHVDDALTSSNSTFAAVGEEGYFINSGINTGCANYGTHTVDREEGTGSVGGTDVSGGQETFNPTLLCNEVTAFTFGDFEGATQKSDSAVVQKVSTNGLNQVYGWMRVALRNQTDAVTGTTNTGLPMIGYAMWSRTFADPQYHYGHIMDNVKFRNQ